MIRFVTCDGCEIPLSKSFIRKHMRNGVFQRLIGEDMKDGLTTVSPHKDEQGRHTILKDLGVKHASFMALLQFLRTRTIRERDLQEAYDVTLRIGGLSAMDKHMRERREKFSYYVYVLTHSTVLYLDVQSLFK